MREVTLFEGQCLRRSGEQPGAVYFPSSSVVATIAVMSDGRQAEITSIGYEGVPGLLPALTQTPSSTRMLVEIGGGAITLSADPLRALAERSPSFRALLLRFAQADAEWAEQSAACYALHPLSARLARWLLLCEDRIDSPSMMLTQDHLGVMAGALRSSVSQAAAEFKEHGLIRYSRGRLEIVDRAGLERCACECYFTGRLGRIDHTGRDAGARRD